MSSTYYTFLEEICKNYPNLYMASQCDDSVFTSIPTEKPLMS